MASVYSNAFITLAATGSCSSDNNLFSSLKRREFHVNSRTPQGGERGPTIFAREPIVHITQRPELQDDQFPLLKRGWVYQERLLSQRVLHFGRDELFWECAQSTKCQCSYLEISMERLKIALDSECEQGLEVNVKRKHCSALAYGNRAAFMASKHLKSKEDIEKMSQFGIDLDILGVRSREIVTEYSGLALTFPNDRLSALSGLAEQMRQYRGSKYLAGLCEDSLFRDLLWVSTPSGRTPLKEKPLWQAPSWS
jgi:hypothetical protein